MRTWTALALTGFAATVHGFGVGMRPRRQRMTMAADDGRKSGFLPQDHFIKDVLTVRAAQAVNYYSIEFHDETKVKWLDEFMKETDVRELGSTQFIYRLLKTEPEEVNIKKMRQMPRGGSGNNPYLKDKGVAIEYTVLIDPMSIARKIMTVRAQIAKEWMHDLSTIEADNAEISRFYAEKQKESRGEGRAVHHMVYDADDPFVTDSSPYRSKNYADLKRVLAKDAVTSAIEHLRELRQTPVATWLESFAQKFAEKHEKDSDSLQGHEIIQELLESNYVMLPSRNGKLRAIEPDKVAMLVMKHRAEHAKAWIEACSEVESDHTKINAMNLEFQYRSASEDVAAALAEQLREEHAARRMRDRENLLSGAASWWEHMEDFEVDDTSA